MSRASTRRLLRRSIKIALTGAVLVGAGLFITERIANMPTVHAALQRKLSAQVRGKVAWDALDVRLLPRPHARLRGARIDIPARLIGQAEVVEVEIDLTALLQGDIEFRRVRVIRPLLQLATGAPGSGHETAPAATTPTALATADASGPIEHYRRAMTPVVRLIKKIAPELILVVEAAEFQVSASGRSAPWVFKATLEARVDRKGLVLEATASGPILQHARLRAGLEFSDLQAQVTLDADRFAPQQLLDNLLSGALVGLQWSEGGLRLKARTDGRAQADATLAIDVRTLNVTRDKGRISLAPVHIKVGAAQRGRDLELGLTSARLGEIVPSAQATLRLAADRGTTLSVEIPALDLARARQAVLVLTGSKPALTRQLTRIKAGQARNLRLDMQSTTPAGLFDLGAMTASTQVSGGFYRIPTLERDATNVAAQVELRDGVISGHDISGRVEGATATAGAFDYRFRDGQLHTRAGVDVPLAKALEVVRELVAPAARVGLEKIETAGGRIQGPASFDLLARRWQGDLAVARSDGQVRLRELPWPISLRSARVSLRPGRLTTREVAGAVGRTTIRNAGVELDLKAPLRIAAAHGSASLDLAELYPWLSARPTLAKSLQPITAVTGTVELSLARLTGDPRTLDTLDFEGVVLPHRVQLTLASLPEPLWIDAGQVRVKPDIAKIETLRAGLLDARADVSGTIQDWRFPLRRADLAVAEAIAGELALYWAWEKWRLPVGALPAVPVRASASRLLLSRAEGLELQANAQPGQGASLEAEVAARPGLFEIQRLRIHGSDSDATLGLRIAGRQLDLRFGGRLSGATIHSMLRQGPGEGQGTLSGDFKATFDPERPKRISAEGRLTAGSLDLGWLTGTPFLVKRFDVDAGPSLFRIKEADLVWNGQHGTVRGELRRSEGGPVVDAQIDTPGLDLEALWQARTAAQPESHGADAGFNKTDDPQVNPVPATEARKADGPQVNPSTAAQVRKSKANALWPLPVTGKVQLNAGSVQWRRYRVEPLKAQLRIERERVQLTATEASLCGVSLPLSVTWTPSGGELSMALQAKDQELEATARCLSEASVLMTGRFDLRARLFTHGQQGTFARNLAGEVAFQARDGEVRRFALLGNILALKDVSKLMGSNRTRLEDKAFRYHKLDLRAAIKDGVVTLEEAAFDSSALGLAAAGNIDLPTGKTKMTVLVAPFGKVDRFVRGVPVIGYVLGGSLTSLPVGVSGDIRDPKVIPLGPSAVTGELLGIFERTLKLPTKMLKTVQPDAPQPQAAENPAETPQ